MGYQISNNPMVDNQHTLRRDLQGLRAIAVFLVVIGHTDLGIFPGGFVGVDVFFVLSGYLISRLLLLELEETNKINLLSFYARRLKRLLPALIFTVVISALLACIILSAVEASNQLYSLQYALTWTSNIFFTFREVDYFNDFVSRDLFLHTWSLGVEEQFYLVWPLFLWLTYKLAASSDKYKTHYLITTLIVFGLLSFTLSLYWLDAFPLASFYLMPSRIWQFSLGALVYCGMNLISTNSKSLKFSPLMGYLAVGLGLTLIFAAAFSLRQGLPYPGINALLPSFGAALIIGFGTWIPQGKNSLLSNPVMVWMGDRSYSFYLWHWPVLILGFSTGYHGQIVPTVGLLLASMTAAAISYRWIELPFWKGRYKNAGTDKTILVSVFAMLCPIVVLPQLIESNVSYHRDDTTVITKRIDDPIIYRDACDSSFKSSEVIECQYGQDTATKKVVLLGDSMGAQWFSIVPALFPEPDWKIFVYTKSSCPMLDEDYVFPLTGNVFQICSDWREAVLKKVDSLKPDVLIMGSSATYEFTRTQWIQGSIRFLERVSKSAKRVVVIPGTPNLGFDGPGCLARDTTATVLVNKENCTNHHRHEAIEEAVHSLQEAVSGFNNVSLLNLNNLVCPNGSCSAIREDGVVVFRDGRHLTDTFVRSLIPEIEKMLKDSLSQ